VLTARYARATWVGVTSLTILSALSPKRIETSSFNARSSSSSVRATKF
jgi:hypothetical protein